MSAISHLVNPPTPTVLSGRVVYAGNEPFPPSESVYGGSRGRTPRTENQLMLQWLRDRSGKAFLLSTICFALRLPFNKSPHYRRVLDRFVIEGRLKTIRKGRGRYPSYYACS